MGRIGKYTDPEFEDHLHRVSASCKGHGKRFGAHFGTLGLVKAWMEKGMNLIMYSNEKGLIKDGMAHAFRELGINLEGGGGKLY